MAFDTIDSKLTIYALANGMDLVKGEGFRQLEWYRDGRDRGIRLVTAAEGIAVEVRAWKGDPESAEVRPQGERLTPDEMVGALSRVLDEATEAANGL